MGDYATYYADKGVHLCGVADGDPPIVSTRWAK